MTEGILCTIEPGTERQTVRDRLPAALGAALFCAALGGGLLQMADLPGVYLIFLLPGCAGALLSLLPRRAGGLCLALLAALAAGMAAFHAGTAADGVCVLLNRLCEASQARQSYVYEAFPVSAPRVMQDFCLWYALLPTGTLLGAVCGAAALFRAGWVYVALLLGLGGGVAYLGVSPGAGWLLLLAVALVLVLGQRGRGREALLPASGVAAAAAALWVGASLLFPGENFAVTAWNEEARDALALRTSAVVEEQIEVPEAELERAPEEVPFQIEQTPGALGGAVTLPVPPRAFWVILLLALLLFLPSAASDRLNKRRKKNRAGLDDPDTGTAVRCRFLYAMRWLSLGGLPRRNVPFSARAEEIGTRFSPQLRARFEEALPLWQEAAYSGHPMDGGQRERMGEFLEAARQAAWEALDRRGRFRARYIEAL